MLTENYIFDKVNGIISELYCKTNVSPESVLSNGENGLDLDSLEIVQLIVKVEDEFDVIIDFDVLFITVGDIVREVAKLLKDKEIMRNERGIEGV